MPISEIENHKAEKVLQKYCADRTKPDLQHLLEIVYRIEGNYAYIAERRPLWDNPTEYRNYDVAKLRFLVKDRLWNLYWLDRNLKWHIYGDCSPSPDIGDLLSVVDEDPIFYG